MTDIPLNAIVGSSGRYKEFTRDFLPGKTVDADRWIRVKLAMIGARGVPPIEAYRIGDVYFVLDGNHRVSVAREMGLTHLEGYVTEVKTRLALSANVRPDDLIVQAEYTDFLERTQQDVLRPDADLRLTASGRYPILLEHIDVHRYYLGLDQRREIPYAEAFTSWFDNVYLPVVQVIRERGLLRDFPERTETDLYLWISQHRGELEKALGWQISADTTARDLKPHHDAGHRSIPARERLLQVLTVDQHPATQRVPTAEQLRPRPERKDRVVDALLVAIDGEESGWNALDQALLTARQENARLLGLHVVPTEDRRSSPQVKAIEEAFEQRCRNAQISGRLAVDVGKTAETICKRARWADLVITGLVPPAKGGIRTRLGSEFRTLMRCCPRSVLVVPGKYGPPQHALLAYDGGPKSEAALYAATYLAGWRSLTLAIVTVSDSVQRASRIQAPARSYLEQHSIQAEWIPRKGPVAQRILQEAREREIDLILMGGYGSIAMVEAVFGSTVDDVLRMSKSPVLILM
ncbi:universal stress protein [Thiorhodococcus mannitoliphagus]|uniref:Universal stress protein n=1 Tax=Thiorhodococcus mannitoliphagus TaxID=329406 RepID=A0A6P1DXX0_9GAMM|nr:universal stress protein [Thiorhodococcus mannitoliphagus]NEX20982.1 universal stress protein [Thiorhodococcus mannitoliphagus]